MTLPIITLGGARGERRRPRSYIASEPYFANLQRRPFMGGHFPYYYYWAYNRRSSPYERSHVKTSVTSDWAAGVEIRSWLAANPRIQVHFTPTSGSWLNLVEVWFGIIERLAIHRGTFGSVKDLNAQIRAFIDGRNYQCHPSVWTKTADEILKKANRLTTSETRR